MRYKSDDFNQLDDLNQLKTHWQAEEKAVVGLQCPLARGPQFPEGAVPIPISTQAREKAARMTELCRNGKLKETMRRNLLATIAVHDYLTLQGYFPDLLASDCWNPILGRTGEVADLVVSQVGRFECCAIDADLPGCTVPMEGQYGRSGYVAVELDKEQHWGWLLGFIPGGDEVNAIETLNRAELQSMDEFGEYLHRLWTLSSERKQATEVAVGHRIFVKENGNEAKIIQFLSQWFDDIFQGGWQTINLLSRSNEFAFAPRTRDMIQTQIAQQDQSVLVARAWKVFELEQSNQKIPLLLMLIITPQSQAGIEIQLKVYPGDDSIYLTSDIHLSIQDGSGTEIYSALSGKEDNWLQCGFFGQRGEAFSIQLMLGDSSISESFRI
jgi:Protein of unknown function (DUF1822)